ncbi:aminoglycoside 6'-N-acetyltransferase [Deinococcus metalli]|uniref:N-acetyltransferase n=1 Tax=Deinococcus metalli TaxID=1141878 RepID=A0A7W8NNZ9_9DEIO|nr:GNAT family protein [Deinococcus metalli]MBB5377464.1 aminoglycoside 6'-N-acetyltransferase [Deinococcus metalli]GHF50622.1 N-acetyltransferase [Deinococcus metalli]
MRHDVTLKGGELTLRPLTDADIGPLCALARDCGDELRFMGSPPTGEAFYRSGLDAETHLPFVILVGGALAGCTRYGDLRPADGGVEIGWTWLHPRHHGTGVNRRMKRLLLAHAFEVMDLERVQLKTDIRNERSQAAIAALGAVREGVLRAHMRRPDGSMRDTVMYSITAPEWPAVKAGMDARISSGAAAGTD